MSPRVLSRADRRRLQRLTHENELTIAADARFFERRPDRSHRIRQASRAEVEIHHLTGRPRMTTLRWYVAVRQLAPGVRFRVFACGLPDLDCDQPEDVCREVYERQQTERGLQIERDFARAMIKGAA